MIVNKGLLPKRIHDLETSNIYVLIIFNKLDFYNIVIEITDITSKKREIKDLKEYRFGVIFWNQMIDKYQIYYLWAIIIKNNNNNNTNINEHNNDTILPILPLLLLF